MRAEFVICILLIGLLTAFLRFSGFWLMGRIKMQPVVKRWLKNLPGSLIVAIVAPGLLSGGLPEILAAAAVILVMLTSKSVLLAMVIGAGVIFLARNFLP